MKTLKLITGIALLSIFSLTSCQSEVDDVQGENPNSANSAMATNVKRVSMYDGSSDDFIDDSSCSAIKFPFVAKVNGVQITFLSQLGYNQAISILGQYNDDTDSVQIQFPITIKMSNYTEVTVNSQSEYEAIVQNCQETEDDSKDAISTLNFNFPITILTFDSSLQQTGSVVISSEQQLFTYIEAMSSTEYFSVKYPITITLADNSSMVINSNAELKASIEAAESIEDKMDAAEDDKEELVTILVNGTFKVNSFINAGVESANNYVGYTIDFANDWKVKSIYTLSTFATGTYSVIADTNVYVELGFTGSTNFNLFNNKWKVSSFTTSTITLQSTTNSTLTLILKQI